MKPLLALDADGVLLDYHHAYARAWEQAFGTFPPLRDAQAYWPMDRWEVRRVVGDECERFRECFDHTFWSTMPALPGAVDACHALCEAGYQLVCVSAVSERYADARLQNLRDCGFPIERVIATSHADAAVSPKAAALNRLRPEAFVDDFLPYLRGVSPDIHTALILREPNGSPNTGSDLALARSLHADLADFARWWLER